ncbi:MAG TPA: nucleotidyltransferase [Bryobacteraceae bacterium]|nr:nucleotidyltransferase [Bryobacteraceae bacterium]
MAATVPAFFTDDAQAQLDDLLMLVCEELQLAPSRYRLAVERYGAVSRVLEGEGSPFRGIPQSIYPQGSMALGTTVHPLDGPHDLDFVFELGIPHQRIDPMALLGTFYKFLKGHGTYSEMVSLKNRCVRITYANDFYLDVLPSCKDLQLGGTCIQVPDRELANWSPSNPKGYVEWFRDASTRLYIVEKAAQPVPPQQPADEKLPLQLAIQLMKRWRDVFYPNPKQAPISIVLTTLVGRCYRGELSPSAALSGAIARILGAIDAADLAGRRLVVVNPSNPHEDLSERWDDNPDAYLAFKAGMRQFSKDWGRVLSGGRETNRLLEELFGEPVMKAVVQQAQNIQERRRANQLGVRSSGVITMASGGATALRPNTFHGKT